MKRILISFFFFVTVYHHVCAQTRIQSIGSPDFTVTNSNTLGANTMSRIFFQNENSYTGGIGTLGTSFNTARLGFFTFANYDKNTLQERLTILNNGFVGVATTNPQYQLHVKAPAAGFGISQESVTGQAIVGFWTSGASAYLQTHNNIPLNFSTNNGFAQLTLATSGRFGIGTTNPVSKLDVRGKTTMTQQVGEDAALEINGSIKVSGSAPAAFVVSATDPEWIVIDHPASNGNPNAIILVTSRFEGSGYLYEGGVRVRYSTSSSKWIIEPTGVVTNALYDEVSMKDCNNTCFTLENVPQCTFSTFSTGMEFNVLVIRA